MNTSVILSKTKALSDSEFTYSYESGFDSLNSLDYGCSGIVMEAIVLCFEIKNLHSLLKTGKRLASRVYKLYHDTLEEVAKQSDGHFSCPAPDCFLLIYPKERYHANYGVDIARKIADLLCKTLKETIEKHSILHFSIGIDMGTILGTKVSSDNGYDSIIWMGNTIEKAKAIGEECNPPFYVGISGTVYHHLDEEHRVQTKRILGFKKQVEIWNTLTYQFENVKKHLYQTNSLIPFEQETVQEGQ